MKIQRIMQFSLWFSLVACAWVPNSGARALAGVPVASVGLAVGPVFRQAGGAQPHKVAMGQALFEGDRLLTGPDAMALLVFSDEARLSLRADSELKITRYRTATVDQPADLRLELVKGAMRQISGSAMRQYPERYRLNTPVAAIGVRGTDFLAKASDQAIETFIQQGTIVILPLGNGCAGTADSRECSPIASLSDVDSQRFASLTSAGVLEKRGVQPQELERLFGIQMARLSSVQVATLSESVGKGTAQTARPMELASAAPAAPTTGSYASNSALGTDLATVRANDTLDEKSATTGTVGAPTTVVSPPVVELPTQLVWGKFSSATDLPFQLPRPYEDASAGRHVTVGEIGQYALWRQGSTGPLDPGLRGEVSYQHVAGEASFQALGSTTTSMAELRSATLSINFDRSVFDSTFSVFHAATGDLQIVASGRLNDEGLFTAINGATRVAGAVSRDGQEAGALFSKEVSSGTVRGITLWRARP